MKNHPDDKTQEARNGLLASLESLKPFMLLLDSDRLRGHLGQALGNNPQVVKHPSFDPLLEKPAAANYLQVNEETLAEWVRTRQIDCVRISQKKGSRIKFRLSALNRWVKSHEIKALAGC